MAEERMHLLNAQDRASQLLSNIDEALASGNMDEMRHHVEKMLSVGQDVQDHLEEALGAAEEPEMADQIEESMQHLNWAIDQGEQALDAADEEAEEYVSEMRKHARQSAERLARVLEMPV